MKSTLVSNDAIMHNLRRSAKKGLISLLSTKELNTLALKYFGVYKDGKLVGYKCPYSGQILTSVKEIVLEHIIPISSNGGTVLFNCIPTSKKVNNFDEKGSNHLINWWLNSKYWDQNAVERLDKIINYILEGYSIIFEKHTLGELLDSYENIDVENKTPTNDFQSDLEITQEIEQIELLRQAERTGLITYYQFISDVINELKENNIDTKKYEDKVKLFADKGIFEEIERITIIQEILKRNIKEKINGESRKELSILINIDIKKLSDSLNTNDNEKIEIELVNRINNIEKILEKNNIGILSYFEDIKKTNILYKKIDEITDEDVLNLISTIKLCVNDKFNKLIEFVTNKGNALPNGNSSNKQERELGKFRYTMCHVSRKNFSIILTINQLQYLHDSKYEVLRSLYKKILYKSIKYGIPINYIDEEIALKINEYLEKSQNATIEKQIQLNNEYEDVIVIESQFYEFIDFVIRNKGTLPIRKKNKYEKEKNLALFLGNITSINLNRNEFNTKLTKEQLEYLYNSEYENLRNIYKKILFKSIQNNVLIDYIDEQMAQRIKEYLIKYKNLSIEQQIILMQEYKDIVVEKDTFIELIGCIIENNGKLLSKNTAKNDFEERLISIQQNIKVVDIKNKRFCKCLTKEQLQYLHDSKYEGLRNIYKEILFKSIKYGIIINYVDKEMALKINKYLEKSQNVTVEEQIRLDKSYKNVIIVENQFNRFIDFVIENNGLLPSRDNAKTDEEYYLGIFRTNIQVVKNNKKFHSPLTYNQLKYLKKSKYNNLNEIYKIILFRAIKNKINIEYMDEMMTRQIVKYLEKSQNATVEEQIQLNKECEDVIVIESQFYKFIDFVIKNNGILPRKSAEIKSEVKLGAYRTHIKSFDKKHNKFFTPLTKEQLQYLHDSEYEGLRILYNEIIEKALSLNFIEYIQYHEEIEQKEKNMKVV